MNTALDLKLRRLHESMGQVRSADISPVLINLGVAGGVFYQEIDFSGGATEAALANIVFTTISNIACLKDHLKAWCGSTVRFDGDMLIDSNRAVGMIHDLWNVDKHFQLTRPPRSGTQPALRDIH